MNRTLSIYVFAIFAIALSNPVWADPSAKTNPPSECDAPDSTCECEEDGDNGQKDDGTGGEKSANNGDSEEDGCIKVRLGLGRTTSWTGSMGCSLKIFADDDAPEIFTPESLHAVLGGYTFKRLGQKNLADGVTPAEVVFSHPNGESVTFVFGEGESWGRPKPGVHRDMDERVLMVDAEGWATTADPVYYDLYPGDGTRRRFLATDMTGRRGSLVSITDARGVTNTPEEMGVDIVYAPYGVRQFLTPSYLADVTHTPDWQGYDVDVYSVGDAIPAKDVATGLYAIPAGNPVKTLSIRRENDGKRAVVSVRRGGGDPSVSVFDYGMGDWSLTRPSGVREEKERMVADSKAAQIVKVVHSVAGTALSRRESNFKWMSWGFAMTNRVDGFGDATETTTWTYYTSGDGKGQVKTERKQSGLLTQYAYDSENRIVSKTRSGPGMMTETTISSYASVDPSDSVPPVDKRPRTVVRMLDGVECARTYYVYAPLTNIVERAGEPGAAYGGTNALRTVTAYWPVVGGDIRSGFVKSVRRENGSLELYDYSLSSNLWTRTITHLHELSPEPVDGRTTRDITVTNRRSETLETRTEAYVEGAWRVIARETRAFNAEGKIVRRENLAGQVTTTDWDCCHKVSETKPDGSVTTWDYDVEGRMVASSKLIPLDMTNVTWLTTYFEYDGLGRQTATWQTNYAAQVGTPATRTRYDALGRIAARTDEHGNTATIAYSADGLTVTTIAANGATTIHTRNTGGDTLSITGSAVTPEFHAYGILPNGARWSRTTRGETADSPRFTKRCENMLGQTFREERSGFLGAVLATTHEYDGYGRLVRTIADGEPTTEYTYDILGTRVATKRITHTLGGAQSSATAEFRLSTSHSSYSILDGDVWLVSATTNSCSDASIAPLVTTTAQQLTGLTAATPARARSTDVRGNVTESALRFNAPFSVSVQSPPHAANDQLAVTRYGVELMAVSVSCVTNTYAYDALGRKVATTDGRGNTAHTEYNAAGQQTASIDALGNRTEYAYDQFGNLSSVTDPLGNATVYEYDLRGRKTYEGGATYPVRYTYDIFGNLSTLSTTRDPAANLSTFQPFDFSTVSWDTTTWLYDEASGAMTNKIYADGMGPTYDYTPNGRLSRRTWARGIVTDYAYDAWGNLTNTVYSDDTPTISLDYDAMGRQTEAHDAAGTTTFAYDAYGSLTNETVIGVAGTNTIERHWDEFGRTAGYALNPDNPVNPVQVSYSYDGLGHFASVSASGIFNSQFSTFNYSYLPGTDLVSGYTSGDFSRSVSYEPHRDLITVVTNTFNLSTFQPFNLSTFAYANDAAGRRISRIDTFDGAATANTFGYNARSEVVSALMGTNSYGYAYDPIGNRLSASLNAATNLYSANSLNQYTSISNLCVSVPPCEPSCDADGNMTADERGWHYFWNGENRMVCASNSEAVVTYAYDHRGRMVRKVVSRRDTEPQRIEYLWDQWNIIHETTTNLSTFQPFNLSTSYVWGLDLDGTLQGAGGVGGLLAVIQSDCTATNSPTPNSPTPNSTTYQLYLPTYDANGNITEYVATNGDIVAHYEYSAFGEPVISSGPLADEFSHQFSTKPYCGVTGFNEYQMRKYRPVIGRWMSRDPLLGNGSILRLYLFCSNDPIIGFDYLGEDAPNIGSPLLPILFSSDPPDKPEGCDQPCSCDNGTPSSGTKKCIFVMVSASISGGWDNFWSHQKHRWFHPGDENRKDKPKCWNPSFCFNAEPTCPVGWDPYGHRSFLTDGKRKMSNTNPAWNFTTGSLDTNCYEMQSREWLGTQQANKGRWCTKCE